MTKERNLLVSLVFILLGLVTHAQFTMNNDAIQFGPDCYRLTQAINSQNGQIWYEKMCDLTQDFEVRAEINLGADNSNGADGMTFTFQNSCLTVGGGAQGLGAGAISPSVNIEFDTYYNSGRNDPFDDHIAFFRDGDLTHGSTNQLPNSVGPNTRTVSNMENNVYRQIIISWNAQSNTLLLDYEGDTLISYTGDIVTDVFGGNPYVYWGFTASTGAADNIHRVCIINYPNNQIKLDDQVLCEGNSLVYGIPGFSTYAWTPNTGINDTTLAEPTFSPLTSTEYYVQYADTCGNTSFDTVFIEILPGPTAGISSNTTEICPGESATISTTLQSGETIQWFENATLISGQNSNSLVTTNTGDYFMVITSSNGCSDTSNTITISSGQPPNANITSNVTGICPGEDALLSTTLQAGETIEWYFNGVVISGATGSSYSTNQVGDYYAIVTNAQGCFETSNTIVINQNPVPNATISSNTTVFCDSNPIDLTASPSGASSYQWFENGSPIAGANSDLYQASASGNYQVSLANSFGCSDTSATLILTNGSTNTLNLNSSNLSFCSGDSELISTNLINGGSYTWYLNGTALTSGIIDDNEWDATSGGDYHVEMLNPSGCLDISDTITLIENFGPTANIVAASTQFCSGDSTLITATLTNGANYEWFLNGSSLGAATLENNSIYATSFGNYWVEISDNCTSTSNTLDLTELPVPDAAGTISGMNSFCAGESDIYSISNVANATGYVWEIIPSSAASIGSGQGTNTVLVNTTNQTFTIQVTPENSCGQGLSNSKIVNVETGFICQGNVLFAANQTNICSGTQVVFTDYTDPSLFFSATAEWDFGPGASPAIATGSGPHTVTYSSPGLKTVILEYVDDFSGMTVGSEIKTDYIHVSGSVNTSNITGNTLLSCLPSTETYSVVSTAGSTYNWTVPGSATITSGQGTSSIQVSFNGNDGTVSVQETTSAGCIGPIVTINVSNPPGPSTSAITGITTLPCDAVNEMYSVVNTNGSTYNWSVPNGATITSGQGTNLIFVNFNGNFGTISVIETDSQGCEGAPVDIFIDCTNSLWEQSLKEVVIFPNPARDIIVVDGLPGATRLLEIVDVHGRIIQQVRVNSEEQITVPIKELETGMYYIIIHIGANQHAKRFVKN